ncbi:MAG: sulfatase-like hydrolase/transferase, partial [Verrucomicrobiae bacterium]|nr:sulfatase-like hydrolase/transferase [Verrucomicrobiae bacterium]
RNGKGSLYEGGIRVPWIVYWPRVTRAGSESSEMVCTTDLYPTLLSVAGTEGDADHNRHVDGINLTGLLRDPNSSLDRETLFFHYPHYYPTTPVSAVRAGEWKLLESHEDGRQELYNLNADPGESANLALALPAKVAQLNSSLRSWKGAVEAQMPQPNPAAANRRAQ